MYSQQTPHILPSRASYGMSIVRTFGENWQRYNSTVVYILRTEWYFVGTVYFLEGSVMISSDRNASYEVFFETRRNLSN